MGRVQLDNLRVVLVSTRNPLNMGATARAMSNFGCTRLRVVNPYELAWREARSAVGAAELLAAAEEFGSVAEAVADCALVVGTTAARERAFEHEVHSPARGGEIIRARLATQPVAVLFGSEKRGLTNEDLSHCHWILHIPTREERPSMNLGQAVAVCLYELMRTESAEAADGPAKLASTGELERLTEVLFEALLESGYVKEQSAGATREKIRRLIRRINLTDADAEVVLGMIRQIVWKLRTGRENG